MTEDVNTGVAGADFVYTDVWLSLGEPEDQWDARIDQLLPYQVNSAVMKATGNPAVKFPPQWYSTGRRTGCTPSRPS